MRRNAESARSLAKRSESQAEHRDSQEEHKGQNTEESCRTQGHSGALVETVKHNAERVREDRGRGKSEHWEWKSYRI